ncbi:B3 domain-containing transcription repressor VAL1 isoform X1 [Camellia sinensis]|uniref:B3 domain-containing transcription repressor VAL1 isoform X1 n=2 Tax=Camellia sinensis TaxID=4442 RepID=UPI001036DEB3|nr:B3 domain-containing transcription repressor VAL1 isoform X1 [Camellia sinensis]XP_028056622.1 B3 domain-containing transcription repressor VAL1 isoform X1 [Camellia sinensis]XP_028056623.1 B3 domain-containing transcription repressor VAL1 isoform X1 [Camellia sinensis]
MAKICMNEACRVTATIEWKNGWGLKSGGFATLCFNCGSAYENLIYCEKFHLEESGWRDCRLCGKHIHCGCIASKHLHDILDLGGVGCISCTKSLEAHSMRPIKIQSDGISNGFGPLPVNNIGDPQSSFVANRMGGTSVDKGKLVQLSKTMDAKELGHFPQTPRTNNNSSIGQIKREEIMLPIGEGGTSFPEMMQQSVGPSIFVKPENSRPILGVKDMYESPAQPSLGFSLGSPLDTSNSRVPSSPSGVMEGREQNKVPPIQQGQRARTILPKPVKTGLTIGSEANKGMFAQTRVPRPPADGRGRSQLLPRYWPRITDQELQQISGDLNSTIVPLFEKVLSASDAGRIGRLVLPKACAEAYFPPISQSDGLPIRVQDIIKGREWTFQFRFWPNNNSRMYVLEGVTPCMQNMQLQAGDTVTFSRIDPGGKLVMGFRKSNFVDMQDGQTSALANGVPSGEGFVSGVNDNLPTHGGRTNEDSPQQLRPILEKKRNRNIGSKSKRLLLHNEEAMELRLTWEEAQELLRPPPSAKPTVVMIDNHEFEEYDEPPVFGKKTTFIVRESGEPDQWAQCDSCSKWRRLPVDVLLPPKWTCLDNIWDLSRCSCSAADEMNPNELGCLLGVSKDFKKRRNTESAKVTPEYESSGLDALATAAVLGENAVLLADNNGDKTSEPAVAVTTKHPRHRPGCTCIVCIQPPSGKGKHKPTCICNVCLTVKRRFKTLMLRRKKRQSECEAEIAAKDDVTSKHALPLINLSENERIKNRIPNDVSENKKGQLDLNCDPNREEDILVEDGGLSMANLVRAVSIPLEMCLRQNRDTNLKPCSLASEGAGESGSCLPDEGCRLALVGEHVNKGDEE